MTLSEADFESAIEAHLLEGDYSYLDPKIDWDVEKSICPVVLLDYIKASQPDEWSKLESNYGAGAENAVIAEICKQIKTYGMLHVLRNGIIDRGVQYKLVQFAPASNLNPDVRKRYDQNHMGVMRQVRFDPSTNQTIDTVLFVNGLPLATAELKNAYTGQSAISATKQYIKDRKPTAKTPLIEFNRRALVHFALDSSEVWMTTRLSGDKTRFLPFNKGNNGRKGNPVNEHGHRTAYLWETIWQKDVWLNIVHSFIKLEEEERTDKSGRIRTTEKLIFPRYHQWSCVTRLLADSCEHGPGKNYLNQHSAGSGKTNTIAWSAHQLAQLHDEHNRTVFDGVIVISDRRNLDSQLQKTVFDIEHKQGLVACITDQDGSKSAQLRGELQKGTKIIVSTLQTFVPLVDGDGFGDRKYAVIVDEAHSGQTGTAAAGVRRSLGREGHDTDDDAQPADRIVDVIKQRGPQPNLSFYAFTATPKVKTLELFGEPREGGKPKPFSLYSMRQAIEERFIMDVLKGYVTYREHYWLAKQIDEDPQHDRRRSRSQLTKFAKLHETAVDQKVAIIVEHFREHIQKKIGGEAKAMVVTSSRMHAVRYKLAMDRYLLNHGYRDLKTLVAFSGTVLNEDNGQEYTEAGMNHITEKRLPDEFNTSEYQLLLVAEKYQTGFDQPLLHTMYVDKPLDGVKAVQTLSRLNRCHPDKRDTCVVDFVNDREKIYTAFKPYYETTTIEKISDPNRIHGLRMEIARSGIIYDDDLESFSQLFFDPKAKLDKKTHGKLDALIQPAVERFVKAYREKASDQDRAKGDALKHSMQAFVRLYEFISQLYPFGRVDLERYYVYVKALASHEQLTEESSDPDDISGEVELEQYQAEKMAEGDIELDDDSLANDLPNPGAGGTGGSSPRPDMASLSDIVREFNERFGYDLSENDLAVVDQVEVDAEADDVLVQQAKNSNPRDFEGKFSDRVVDLFIDRQGRNEDFFNIIMSDDGARKYIVGHMLNAFMKKHHGGDQ